MVTNCECENKDELCPKCDGVLKLDPKVNDELKSLRQENKQLQNRIDELEKYVDDNEKYKTKWLTLNSWIVTQEKEAGQLIAETGTFTGKLDLPKGVGTSSFENLSHGESILNSEEQKRIIKKFEGMTATEAVNHVLEGIDFNADDVPVGGLKEDE